MTSTPLPLKASRANLTPIKFQVRQRGYGDCQTIAVLVALDHWRNAKGEERGERLLSDMVRGPDKSGNYTVTFPGRPEAPVSVTKDMLKDPGLMEVKDSTDPKLANLPRIIEAAYLHIHRQESSVVNPVALFLGPDAPTYGLFARDILTPFAESLLNQGRGGRDLLVSLYTKQDVPPEIIQSLDVPPKSVSIIGNHVYTLQVQDGRFFLMNPHDTRGRFEISKQQIADHFQKMHMTPAPGVSINLPPQFQKFGEASIDLGRAMYGLIENTGGFSSTNDGRRHPSDEAYKMYALSHGRYMDLLYPNATIKLYNPAEITPVK